MDIVAEIKGAIDLFELTDAEREELLTALKEIGDNYHGDFAAWLDGKIRQYAKNGAELRGAVELLLG
jgi:hypothetical protein